MNELIELSNQLESIIQLGSSVVDALDRLHIADDLPREDEETTCTICRCDF